MKHERRDLMDLVQNVLIALLSISALFLFNRTQLYHLGTEFIRQTFFDAESAPSDLTAELPTVAAPVRIAVTGDYGHYGCVTLTTDSEDFDLPGKLLREALGSARGFSPCSEQAVCEAIGRTCVYYDFLAPLPLAYLADTVGGACAYTDSVRCVVIAETGGAVNAYLWDGAEGYLVSGTALLPGNLADLSAAYELGGASFAFESDPPVPFDPCLLLPDPLPALTDLQCESAAADESQLLSSLGFNPRTKSRYVESDGTEVIVEGDRFLRIRSSGVLEYSGAGQDTVTVRTASPQEVAGDALSLVQRLASSLPGGATLYLTSIRQEGETWRLTFGYQIGGIPIRFAGGADAAALTVVGHRVDTLTLHLRSYRPTEKSSLLLPLRQSAAIAAAQGSRELFLAYLDDGGDSAAVGWVTD